MCNDYIKNPTGLQVIEGLCPGVSRLYQECMDAIPSLYPYFVSWLFNMPNYIDEIDPAKPIPIHPRLEGNAFKWMM